MSLSPDVELSRFLFQARRDGSEPSADQGEAEPGGVHLLGAHLSAGAPVRHRRTGTRVSFSNLRALLRSLRLMLPVSLVAAAERRRHQHQRCVTSPRQVGQEDKGWLSKEKHSQCSARVFCRHARFFLLQSGPADVSSACRRT